MTKVLIDLDQVKAALDERVALIAVMLVNNEIGVIQPVGEIARMARDAGALMLPRLRKLTSTEYDTSAATL